MQILHDVGRGGRDADAIEVGDDGEQKGEAEDARANGHRHGVGGILAEPGTASQCVGRQSTRCSTADLQSVLCVFAACVLLVVMTDACMAGYSCLSAIDGSTRIARAIGTPCATSATPSRTPATAMNVTGSVALTS